MNDEADGVLFFVVLQALMVIAKVVGFITWSWWWVFVPIWGPFASALLAVSAGYIWIKIKGD